MKKDQIFLEKGAEEPDEERPGAEWPGVEVPDPEIPGTEDDIQKVLNKLQHQMSYVLIIFLKYIYTIAICCTYVYRC